MMAARPVRFGVSRQYKGPAASHGRDAIFEDLDAAREWALRPEQFLVS